MNTRHTRKPTLKIYSEAKRNFVQMPTDRAVAFHKHLRGTGAHAHIPMPVMMGIHSVELPADSNLVDMQLLIDQWALPKTPPAPVEQPQTRSGMYSRTTMFPAE